MYVTKGQRLFLQITLKNTKTAQKEYSGYKAGTLKNIFTAKLSQMALVCVQTVIFQVLTAWLKVCCSSLAIRISFSGTIVAFLAK